MIKRNRTEKSVCVWNWNILNYTRNPSLIDGLNVCLLNNVNSRQFINLFKIPPGRYHTYTHTSRINSTVIYNSKDNNKAENYQQSKPFHDIQYSYNINNKIIFNMWWGKYVVRKDIRLKPFQKNNVDKINSDLFLWISRRSHWSKAYAHSDNKYC